MRSRCVVIAAVAGVMAALLCTRPGRAAADETAVEGAAALGVGAFGARPATTVDVGVDVARGDFAVGLGARLRVVAGAGVRGADWDEPGEAAGVVRYATWRREAIAVVVGPLAGAVLGHGAIVDGYTAGLNVDHGQTGMQAVASAGRARVELLVDDLIVPTILATRGGFAARPQLRFGLTAARDRTAPRMTGADGATLLGLDGEWTRASKDGRWLLTTTGDLVSVVAVGAGVHGGARLARYRDGVPMVELGVEGRLGSAGYLPGWFSPLYQLARVRFDLDDEADADADATASQLDAAAARRFGAAGARVQLAAARPALGSATLAWEVRAGVADLLTARLALPAWRSAQLGVFLAAESPRAAVFAAELRLRLPSRLFVTAELARLYRDDPATVLESVWLANVSVGAVLGD